MIRIFYRGTKPFALARVFFWGKPGKPDVVTLQFENSMSDKGKKPCDYMEGHYLYLQCPHIEGKNKLLPQWHPFTISSVPSFDQTHQPSAPCEPPFTISSVPALAFDQTHQPSAPCEPQAHQLWAQCDHGVAGSRRAGPRGLTYLLTYLPTYLLTYLLTYLPTYLRTYLLTYLLTYLGPRRACPRGQHSRQPVGALMDE